MPRTNKVKFSPGRNATLTSDGCARQNVAVQKLEKTLDRNEYAEKLVWIALFIGFRVRGVTGVAIL